MAIVQYTAIVQQLRGKLNGSVFNKTKNGYTLQGKQMPSSQQSALQLRRRASFSAIQRTWKQLTPSERSIASLAAQNNPTRDRFGNEVVLSGYNHFVKANLMILLTGAPLRPALASASANAFSVGFDSAFTEFTQDIQGNVMVSTGASLNGLLASANTLGAICYISFPHSRGVSNYTGRWFFVGSVTRPIGGFPIGAYDLDFESLLGINYPVPESPQQILIRIDFWSLGNGALVQRVERVSTY